MELWSRIISAVERLRLCTLLALASCFATLARLSDFEHGVLVCMLSPLPVKQTVNKPNPKSHPRLYQMCQTHPLFKDLNFAWVS